MRTFLSKVLSNTVIFHIFKAIFMELQKFKIIREAS